MKRLEGKTAVVTGGNSGIGLAAAKLSAAEGAQVVITARRQSVLDEAVAEGGHGSFGIVGDVADLEHHGKVVEAVADRFVSLNIYMANAGIISLSPTPASLRASYIARASLLNIWKSRATAANRAIY